MIFKSESGRAGYWKILDSGLGSGTRWALAESGLKWISFDIRLTVTDSDCQVRFKVSSRGAYSCEHRCRFLVVRITTNSRPARGNCRSQPSTVHGGTSWPWRPTVTIHLLNVTSPRSSPYTCLFQLFWSALCKIRIFKKTSWHSKTTLRKLFHWATSFLNYLSSPSTLYLTLTLCQTRSSKNEW